MMLRDGVVGLMICGTMLTGYDWRTDEEYNRFIEAYLKTGCIPIESDWAKAHFVWRTLDFVQKGAACAHVPTSDGAYVKLPQNYLRDREFERARRPAPRGTIERKPPVSILAPDHFDVAKGVDPEELEQFLAAHEAKRKAQA